MPLRTDLPACALPATLPPGRQAGSQAGRQAGNERLSPVAPITATHQHSMLPPSAPVRQRGRASGWRCGLVVDAGLVGGRWGGGARGAVSPLPSSGSLSRSSSRSSSLPAADCHCGQAGHGGKQRQGCHWRVALRAGDGDAAEPEAAAAPAAAVAAVRGKEQVGAVGAAAACAAAALKQRAAFAQAVVAEVRQGRPQLCGGARGVHCGCGGQHSACAALQSAAADLLLPEICQAA
eukprot:1158835-Pelagomonas_calceolata.AAC.23